jgi:hypothetical protein
MLEYSELVLGPFEILTNLGLDPLPGGTPRCCLGGDCTMPVIVATTTAVVTVTVAATTTGTVANDDVDNIEEDNNEDDNIDDNVGEDDQ